jgi:hypothetical protein
VRCPTLTCDCFVDAAGSHHAQFIIPSEVQNKLRSLLHRVREKRSARDIAAALESGDTAALAAAATHHSSGRRWCCLGLSGPRVTDSHGLSQPQLVNDLQGVSLTSPGRGASQGDGGRVAGSGGSPSNRSARHGVSTEVNAVPLTTVSPLATLDTATRSERAQTGVTGVSGVTTDRSGRIADGGVTSSSSSSDSSSDDETGVVVPEPAVIEAFVAPRPGSSAGGGATRASAAGALGAHQPAASRPQTAAGSLFANARSRFLAAVGGVAGGGGGGGGGARGPGGFTSPHVGMMENGRVTWSEDAAYFFGNDNGEWADNGAVAGAAGGDYSGEYWQPTDYEYDSYEGYDYDYGSYGDGGVGAAAAALNTTGYTEEYKSDMEFGP